MPRSRICCPRIRSACHCISRPRAWCSASNRGLPWWAWFRRWPSPSWLYLTCREFGVGPGWSVSVALLAAISPLVLTAAALPWLKIDRRKKFTLLAWAGVVFLLYAAYEPTQETWWYLRFILPALPALAIAAALALQQISYPSWFLVSRVLPAEATPEQVAQGRIVRLPFTVLLFVATAGWLLMCDRSLHVSQIELEDRTYPEVGRWVAEQMPPRAIVAAYQVSGALLYYSDRPFINPINLVPKDHARFSAWLDREHRPLYAVLLPLDEADILQRLPGRWEVVTRIRQATVWRRLGPGEPSATTPPPSNRL